MNYADRERARLEAAQQQATDAARAGMKAPGAEMVAVFSVAGFELAEIFAEWARRGATITTAELLADTCCNGLGPPWLMQKETPEEFGQRVARAILQLIKEV